MSSHTKKRPFILVTAEERSQILEKIETQDWAKDIFTKLKEKADFQVKSFNKNPKTYLDKLPFNWSEGQKNSFPPFYKSYHVENGVQKNLDNATDAEQKYMELLDKYLQVPLIVKVPGKSSGKQTEALVESVDIYPTLCDLANLKTPDYIMGKSFTSVINNPKESYRENVYARFKKSDAIVTDDFTYSLFENGEEMLYN